MTFPYRKVFKSCFTIVCTITVAFMMGYWFYKYKVEDRDIGVVDYALMEDAEPIKFPDVSLCIDNPFHVKNLKASNSNISVEMYSQYLVGEHYDKMYEEIDFSNVTVDLNQYPKYAEVRWQNGTLTPISSDSINYIETFRGFDSPKSSFMRCFTVRLDVEEKRRVKIVSLFFDNMMMIPDLSADYDYLIYLVVHYPNQFFLLKTMEVRTVYLDQVSGTSIHLEKMEILKQRNSRHRKCSKDIDDYDQSIVDEVLHKAGCRPPYIKSHQFYPKCKTKNDIKEGKIDILARKRVQIPYACQRISEVRHHFENTENYYGTWILSIAYPEEVKIITQSKDVDVHSLIGNIGGYLGLFLGEKTIQAVII